MDGRSVFDAEGCGGVGVDLYETVFRGPGRNRALYSMHARWGLELHSVKQLAFVVWLQLHHLATWNDPSRTSVTNYRAS